MQILDAACRDMARELHDSFRVGYEDKARTWNDKVINMSIKQILDAACRDMARELHDSFRVGYEDKARTWNDKVLNVSIMQILDATETSWKLPGRLQTQGLDVKR